MRLWTLHPSYLDAKGLVAAWREGLLAQKVLRGATAGYTHHPQLERFKSSADPIGLIGSYLREIAEEGRRRGYRFDESKILGAAGSAAKVAATEGQLRYEFALLKRKLSLRNPLKLAEIGRADLVAPNAAFYLVGGAVEPWEKIIPELAAAAEEESRKYGIPDTAIDGR